MGRPIFDYVCSFALHSKSKLQVSGEVLCISKLNTIWHAPMKKWNNFFPQVGANDLTARRLGDRKINLEAEGIN